MTSYATCGHVSHFDPSGTQDLPRAARLWLTHAIEPGTPLFRCARYTMHGEIKLKNWNRFTAEQTVLAGARFVWTAHTRLFGLPVSGYDCYADGSGSQRWRMLGFVPVATGSGPDVTLSAAGRLAAESVMLPSSLVDAEWEHVGARFAAFTRRVDGYPHRVVIEVDDDGTLRRVFSRRWGNPGSRKFGYHHFAVRIDAENRFGGQLIPSRYAAMWPAAGAPDSGEFFRAELDTVEFGPSTQDQSPA